MFLVSQVGHFIEENDESIWFVVSRISRRKIDCNLTFVSKQFTLKPSFFNLSLGNA
jgi:hypothetical protein